MLFTTLNQGYLATIFIFFGIIIGYLYEICLILEGFKFGFIRYVIDLIFGLIFSLVFIFCLNLFNFGEFRFYLLLSYFLGLFFERKTVGDLFQKMIKFLCKTLKNIAIKLKTNKVVSKIFK